MNRIDRQCISTPPPRCTQLAVATIAAVLLAAAPAQADDDEDQRASYDSSESSSLTIDSAYWSSGTGRLQASGSAPSRTHVILVNAYDPDQTLGDDETSRRSGSWSITKYRPEPIPCRVRAVLESGQSTERDVSNAPPSCAPKTPTTNQPPTTSANGPYSGTTGTAVGFDSAGSSDPDGTIASYRWDFGDGATSVQANPSHVYAGAGSYSVSLTVTDDRGASASDTTTATIVDPAGNLPPSASVNGPYRGSAGVAVSFSSAGSGDPDGTIAAYGWDFGDGATSTEASPSHTYAATGSYDVSLTVTDNAGATATASTSATITDTTACGPLVAPPELSINSTSQGSLCQNTTAVPEQPIVINGAYTVLAVNDLGMHCGDLDTRIASILPPFQVLITQVVQKGDEPTLNPPGITLSYSAASNPNDPILSSTAFDGLEADGSTYKTNFWDAVAAGTYDPFYPGGMGITPLGTGTFPTTTDVGLPVPNVEELHIGTDGVVDQDCDTNPANCDGTLTAVQHAMPGLSNPYVLNDPQAIQEHYDDKPFFVGFPFGYVAPDVNWYEGAGVPFAAFDDFGRENPYPLVRVQARSGSNVVATLDTVLPISAEASCTNCHSDPADVQGSRTSAPTDALANAGLPVATSLDDPDPGMPPKVSVEYAADINILRLHDLRHGPDYVDTANAPAPCDINANDGNGDANCLTHGALIDSKPVVCQVCHYTPALDLAQAGPVAGPPGSEANGRNQLAHQSNSRVMHNHHGQFSDLFPAMPAPAQSADGTITNQGERLAVLEQTCYQCHPGTSTKCLRGAMFDGGMLCNDCHGSMAQVGADFSAGVSPGNPGAFVLDQGNFYDPHSSQPRVPWANEPGCGSCHTGDAGDNLAATMGVLVNTADMNGNSDGIRLRQAYVSGDAKATPIVPTNKRFAEPAVPASFNGFANPGAGNPQLYRVSTGHGGIFCEGCHGATHAEWSSNDGSMKNDNVAANQLQGHPGTIVECSVCHGSAMDDTNTLGGPHGMHPVGEHTRFADGGHEHMDRSSCTDCHGPGGRSSNTGTVLSVAKADRDFRGLEHGGLVAKGEPIGCATCHD